MAEKVTYKRTSRVTFVGVSNLPREKALQLRDILQNIITHLSALHGTVSDARITVDARNTALAGLGGLRAEVDALEAIARAQGALCEAGTEASAAETRAVLSLLLASAASVRSLLDNSRGAFEIVEQLLALVKHTVDLLRAADRYTVNRVEQMTQEVQKLAEAVATTKSIPDLVEKAAPLSRAALDVARIAEQRATALDQNNSAKDVRDTLHSSSADVGTFTPQVILAAKESITSGRPISQDPLHALTKSLKNIAHATRVAPEFSVIFDVDYLDTELGLKLAALAEAVRGGDRIGVATNAKAVDKEIDRRINLAKKDPKLEPVIRAAKAASVAAQGVARETLNTRLAHPEPHAGPYLAADRQMMESFAQLKQAAADLPDAALATVNSQVPLIQAARALSLQLWSLLQQ